MRLASAVFQTKMDSVRFSKTELVRDIFFQNFGFSERPMLNTFSDIQIELFENAYRSIFRYFPVIL